MIKGALRRLGYDLVNLRSHFAADGLYTAHQPRFRSQEEFADAYRRGVKASGHDPGIEWRVHVALWAASTALGAPGDFVECGVNAGFVSSAILEYLDFDRTGRRYYLVDTFAGPVAAQYSAAEVQDGRLDRAEEARRAGAYVTDVERVTGNFRQWPSATVVQGAVPDVLPRIPAAEVAFLHLDLNCAYPEVAALEYFWTRMRPGAVVLFDDYTYFGHHHQGDAIDQFLKKKGARVLALPTGQGIILRSEPLLGHD